ncbi:MAG: DUF4153 domain-containing protein, partial [Candidatus Gracilibacteria bacterium]|nr:DUF4153 domain-containing protein [Candidatus Gracilibacteria bacterium]
VQHANYFTLVAWTKLMSGIVGGAVLLLGFIAIGSVTELFDLSGAFFHGKIYGYWATIALALIAPVYALIHFPEPGEIKKDTYDTNRFFSFLVRFVGIPFILIYFVILYAYSIRVLMNFHDWPNGIISWLVIGFSIFGYLIYIFSESYMGEGKFIAPFRKYFPFAVLPQILMLFYAIYLRIAQYDLTMNRYFVVVFGTWLTIISLYYVISKRKLILFIPATLTLISLGISFGPWGVFSLPLDRQYDRFMTDIKTAGILQNGEIHPLTKTIDASLENGILSEVQYICEYRTCEKIRPLFQKTLEDAEEKDRKNWESSQYKPTRYYPGLSSWEAASAIQKAMNVQHRSDTDVLQNRKYVILSVEYKERDSYYPLDLTGYQSLLKVQGTDSSAPGARFVSIDPEHDSLTIRDGADTETISLSAITARLQAKYGSNTSYDIDQNDLDFTLIGEKHEIRVILDSYSYKNPKYKENGGKDLYGSPSINGIALIKGKK